MELLNLSAAFVFVCFGITILVIAWKIYQGKLP